MKTMNRRVIYMSDTEWGAITEVARSRGETISAFIRKEVGLVPRDGWNETANEKAGRDFGEHAVDAENAIAAFGDQLRVRPIRPVPKPMKRK